jgi:hypothetical protein
MAVGFFAAALASDTAEVFSYTSLDSDASHYDTATTDV